MDRKSVSFLALGLVVGALLSTVVFIGILRHERAGPAGGQRIVLKLGHALDQAHPVHAAMEFMAKRVAALSDGTVEIQMFPNGQLGSEPECIEQTQRGALAITKISAAAMEGFVPEMGLFGLPYLFRDEAHYWNVLNSNLGRELLAKGDRVGLHGLCYYDSGARSFYTVDRPILTPGDVKELKLRVMSSKTARDLIVTLGGGATPIPWGELYTALQQGMVNGAENNPPSFLTSRHYEVAKHYSLNEHTRIPDIIVVSQKVWQGLPDNVRGWLAQAATESVAFQRQLWAEKTEEALREVVAKGVNLHRPDQRPFVAATAAMYAPLQGTPMGEWVTRIRNTP